MAIIFHLLKPGRKGEWTHMICMPGVTKEKVDEFINDMVEEIKLKPAFAEV